MRSARFIGAIAAVAAGLLLSGCAPLGAADPPEARAEAGARTAAAALADRIGIDRPADIDEVARQAVASGADLVGIERIEAVELIDPFGALTTRIEGSDGEAYCFRIEYDYYGRHAAGTGSVFGTTDGVGDVDCDASTPSVAPPPDTRAIPVTAANAEAAATEVLAGLPADPGAADTIAAAIAGRLEAPTGGREVVAPPTAVVEGGDVGVAMGAADDCVLVARRAGVVIRVLVPPVLLQPGEYGCAPETALLPAESLRSPH